MNELEPGKKYDQMVLYLRADERQQTIEARQHDGDMKLQAVESNLKSLENRVNFGVAKTGQETKDELAELTTRVALLEREKLDLQGKYEDLIVKIFDKDTGLLTQFLALRDWQSNFNKVMVGFFITGCAGGLILWGVRNFR